jgi:colanic acid/amylovoran biosynthesis glycosyltransferase
MKRIGLVLANSPGYSETFLRNKIKVLSEAGFEVFLFSDRFSAPVAHCRQVSGFTLPSSSLARLLKVIYVVAIHLVIVPHKMLRFIALEWQDGRTFSMMMRNLFRSAHILRYRLDWLHFGFVTLAVGRENVARATSAKMGVSFRGYDISIYPLKHPDCYKLTWKRVDRVHTISDDLYKVALALGLSSKIAMMKITPAIDTNRFTMERVSVLGRSVQILTTARLHWKKGLDIAMNAMKLLKEQGVSFQYYIVGDGEEYDRLVYLRYILKLENDVVFLLRKTPEELLKLLYKADLYLQPSTQEGFCNSTLEAQASGLLCIVSDAEGLSENVMNEITGWVVPKLDPIILVSKIQQVLSMPEVQKNSIRQAAIARVKAHFDLKQHSTLFPQFFN